MHTERSPWFFSLTLALAALALVATVAIINALVDPYGLSGRQPLPGINTWKPEVFSHVRIFKAHEVRRIQPQTLILGAGSTQTGLRCTHPALARQGAPCYNLAFENASTAEMLALLRHAQAGAPVKNVVLGLDIAHLIFNNTARSDSPGDLVPHALPVLLSLDTLAASLRTLQAQDAAEPSWLSADGQWLGEVYFHRAQAMAMPQGPRTYFDDSVRALVRGYTHAEGLAGARASSLADIEGILAFCRAHDIALTIFITPGHAHQLEIAEAAGARTALENGKRALVRLLAMDATRHPGRAEIRLADFSGVSSVNDEPLPDVGSTQEMRNFWDVTHFKADVGDRVLDYLFGWPTAREPSADFGVPLNATTLEGTLGMQRLALARFRAEDAAMSTKLRGMVEARRARIQARVLDAQCVPPIPNLAQQSPLARYRPRCA